MSIDCIGMLPGDVSMKYRGKNYVRKSMRCNVYARYVFKSETQRCFFCAFWYFGRF